MTSNIEAFFNLNDYERNIIWKAARAGNSPMTGALFQLYFPQLSPDDIRNLIRDVSKVDHMAGAA
jgi:hypothetical protein